jgi:hypothetical protein
MWLRGTWSDCFGNLIDRDGTVFPVGVKTSGKENLHRPIRLSTVAALPSSVGVYHPTNRLPWTFAEWFIVSQTFLPAILYVPGSQRLRVLIRVASYGISLVALAYYWVNARQNSRRSIPDHPSVPWLVACLGLLGLMLLHPTTNSYLAGLAQIALYTSILAPVFWAPALVQNPARLQRLLWLLLLCNGINSFVGVMQVHNPGVWMPREFSSVIMGSDYGLDALTYEGANGQMVIRPPGLGDSPGAVCGPAVFALYFGLVFAVMEKVWWKKIFAAVLASLGAAAIFLTLVRTSFLISVGMVVVYVLIQIGQGQAKRAGSMLVVGFIAITAAFVHSTSVGGDSVVNRFHTIVEDSPTDFYMENRGGQVADGFVNLLPQYPLGAGLGRWGMMRGYFGNEENANSPSIWVEIQFPAWIVDGGIILLVLYMGALLVAIKYMADLTFRHPDERVRTLAGIILAGNAGLIAHCFSYPVFLSPIGMQFWFLVGALHGIAKPGAQTKGLRPRVRKPISIEASREAALPLRTGAPSPYSLPA